MTEIKTEIKTEIEKRHVNPLVIVLGVSAVLFSLFLIFSMVYYFSKGNKWNGSEGNKEKMFSNQGEYVAVIELKGVIMDSKKILRNLKEAEEDHDIKGVLLRLNSPGGAVSPSQEIYEAVKKFPKPLVVSMASVAASGAYYIAAGAKKVYANAGTLTGSIGVIMEFINLKKLYDWAKVERYSIKTGKFKDSGADYRDLAPEEREYFQNLVLNTLDQFKAAVAEGRKMTAEEVTAIADGRVFTGEQAKKLKMVDEIGTQDDAIAALAKLANIKGKPKLVYPVKKMKGLQDLLLGGRDDEEGFEEDSESSAGNFVENFFSKVSDRVTDRIFGKQTQEALIRPAGLYWIWNGPR